MTGNCIGSDADMCSACCAAFVHAAGPYGVSGSGPIQNHVLEALCRKLVFPTRSHDPYAIPSIVLLRERHITTLLAPMISNRLSERSPIFVVAPRRCLPPVECCLGTSPSQAAKSRPRGNVSGGGARATSAVAMSGPIPGTVLRRRAVSFDRARRAISTSSSLI